MAADSPTDLDQLDALIRPLVGEAVPGRDLDVAMLTVWLTRLSRAHESSLARLAAEHDLMPSETAVLFALWSAPEHRLRPSVLASQLVQSSGGMTATLRRLEQVGFVRRVPDPNDGRVSLAELTAAGRRVGLASFDHMVGWYEEALGDTSTTRRRQLLGATRQLLASIESLSAHSNR